MGRPRARGRGSGPGDAFPPNTLLVIERLAHESYLLEIQTIPREFEYPFPGKLYIDDEIDWAKIATACGLPRRVQRAWLRSTTRDTRAQIQRVQNLLAERWFVEREYDYEMLKRHEIAHCNGWRHGCRDIKAS